MRILLALIVFSVIVLFHEFGHFLLAKLNHVVVVEFSLGMGPRLFSFVKGETRYSVKILPFGGSCMMLGEDMADLSEGTFGSKSVWARISIVAAGPVFNFILAWLMAFIIISSVGIDRPVLLAVSEGYPAEEAGIAAMDEIVSIDGHSIRMYREIDDFVTFHQDRMSSGEPIEVVYIHEGEKKTVMLVPVDNGYGRYIFGIVGDSNYRTKCNPLQTAYYSAREVRYWITEVALSLRMMFTGQVTLNDVSGPVGVVDAIGETYEQSKSDGAFYVWLNMLNIAILLSANLGVMNLLPIPALDGGRLLFLIVEAIRRKRLDPEIEGKINLAGMAVLLALMFLIMFNDVRKII